MLALLLLYIVVPLVQVALLVQGRSALSPLLVVNYAASVLALHWILANIFVTAKIPWFQKALPYDRRVRFHAMASMGVLLALVFHAGFKILAGKHIDAISWILLAAVLLLFAGAMLWRKKTGKGYDRSKQLHKAMLLVVVLLVFLHVAQAEYLEKIPAPSLLIFLAYYLVALFAYVATLFGAFRKSAEVVSIQVRQDILEVELRLKRPLRYQAGQFVYLRAPGVRGREEHPFSILSVPGDSTLRLAIRMLGDFTRSLAKLPIGAQVSVHGGYGAFYPGSGNALCFVASGIGMVPVLGVLQDLAKKADQRQMFLFLAIKDESEVPASVDLAALQRALPGLKVVLLRKADGLRFSAKLFAEKMGEAAKFRYYLCSSPGVRKQVLHALHSLHVPKQAIFYEEFSLH